MVSNEEIKLRLEAKRYGLDPDELVSEGLDLEKELKKLQIPHEWMGDVCVFDFGSVHVENLSTIIGDLFKSWKYRLKEGTPLKSVYKRVYTPYRGSIFIMPRIYRYKVEIYATEG